MIDVIIAPLDAPQVFSAPPPRPAPCPRRDRLDERIIAEVRRHGSYGGHVWTVLNAVALEEEPKERHEQRRMRQALWRRLRALLHQGAVFRFARHYVSLSKIKRERNVRRRRSLRAGSALARASHASGTANPNYLSLNLLDAVARCERKKETKSAPGPVEISQAARLLARMTRGPRQRTGHFNGQPARRGQAIRLQDGRQVFLWGCVRHRIVWSLDPKVLLMDIRNPDVEWGVVPERGVSPVKNPAAMALGALKRGHREVYSARKGESARRNGKQPCRPGRKRGRPAKHPSTP